MEMIFKSAFRVCSALNSVFENCYTGIYYLKWPLKGSVSKLGVEGSVKQSWRAVFFSR